MTEHGPPITILKPVAGLEPSLYENLRSFCDQDYGAYQVVFGTRDRNGSAIPVIERLIEEFPHHDLELVIDPRIAGPNYKMSNLANMEARAKYDVLVAADSDVHVGPDYLSAIAACFRDPKVGAATCLYSGVPAGNWSSILAAMFINEWFFPSVRVGLLFEELQFCFGATMAIRREALDAIGGFEALTSYLADDHMLGKLVADRGYAVQLSPYIVQIIVAEPSLRAMLLKELRWARTYRSLRPVKFALSFLTDALPLSIIAALTLDLNGFGVALIGAALLLRVALHYAVRAPLHITAPARPWLVPVRDLLLFGVRVASFFGHSVHWRGQKFDVRPDGRMLVPDEAPIARSG